MVNESRRTILKGMGCGAAILAGIGTSSVVFSASQPLPAYDSHSLEFIEPGQELKVYLQWPSGVERVTLFNNNQRSIRFDGAQSARLHHVNGSLVVKLKQSAQGDIIIKPDQQLDLIIDASNGETIADLSGAPYTLVRSVDLYSHYSQLNGTLYANMT